LQRSMYAYLTLVIHLLAAICCGSKFTFLCVFLGQLFGLIFIYMASKKTISGKIFWLSAFLIICLFDVRDLEGYIPDRLKETFEARFVTWGFGIDEFFKYPILGHGFGGWEEAFRDSGEFRLDLGVTEFSAPLNTLIYLWSKSGIVALVLGVLFIRSLFTAVAGITHFTKAKLVQYFVAVGVFSMVCQGMGENYGLFGELHIMQPFALILTFAYIFQDSNRGLGIKKPT
jgi:O-antigen ligase